jgi:hypothetical protein
MSYEYMISKKRCLNCQVTYPPEMFAPHKRKLCGLSDNCLNCNKRKKAIRVRELRAASVIRTKEWRLAHRGKFAAYNQSSGARFRNGKYAAKRRNVPWELLREDYNKLLESPCHYCGGSLKLERGTSLDRRDNSLGYTPNNVLPCCGNCNLIRGCWLTVDEMIVAMKAVVEYRQQKAA